MVATLEHRSTLRVPVTPDDVCAVGRCESCGHRDRALFPVDVDEPAPVAAFIRRFEVCADCLP
jgi:hypothetical protein